MASILLAFGIDAWWDRIQDRAEEQEILIGLRGDFLDIAEQLDIRVTRAEEITADVDFLLTLHGRTPADIPVARADTAMRRFIQAPTFQPSQATLDALVGSGRLDLIENRTLREELSRWRYVLDEATDDEVVAREFIRETLVPYLARSGVPLLRAYGMPGAQLTATPTARQSTIVSDSAVAVTYARVFNDIEFRSLAAYRQTWVGATAVSLEEARQFVTGILDLLDEEIRPS